jgi:hypothetical protein
MRSDSDVKIDEAFDVYRPAEIRNKSKEFA